jgi:hypothetical protein
MEPSVTLLARKVSAPPIAVAHVAREGCVARAVALEETTLCEAR